MSPTSLDGERIPIASPGDYAKITRLVEGYIELHRDEKFDLDIICRELRIFERENRKYIAIELARKVKQGKLEKSNRSYRILDNVYKELDWVNASEKETLGIVWPRGHEDNTGFGFDGRVVISPGDVIVIAGVSNMGKTCFCLNVLWENMDTYPCTIMGNEYTAGKFRRRVSRMDWKNPLKADGKPKFELIDRRENWKDIIRPDNINIIDWISLSGKAEFYAIGSVIEGIQSKLRDGIALISLQKSEGKSLGEGGQFSEHLASLYFVIDHERLTVRKAKEWKEDNPNGKMYGFTIVNGGTKFHHIREIKKCGKCWGSGKSRGSECELCLGTGFVDCVDKEGNGRE